MVKEIHLELFNKMENTLNYLENCYKCKFNFDAERNQLNIIGKLLFVLEKCGEIEMKYENQRKYWTDEEVKKLIEYHIQGLSLNKQSEQLKRTRKAISSKRIKLGIKTHKWTNEELKTLIMEIL